MYFTEVELQLIMHWALWRTSKSLGLIPEDGLPVEDAVELIAAVKGHRDALSRLARAYVTWYEFHLQIHRDGKGGSLTLQENARLQALIEERDAAKEALLDITPID